MSPKQHLLSRIPSVEILLQDAEVAGLDGGNPATHC